MKRLISQIVSAILGLWLADYFIQEVSIKLYSNSNFFGISLTSQWQILAILGITLGLINFFLKPIINAVTLPLRIITLGLFSIIINMGFLWIIDLMFEELNIPLFLPLFWTTLIIWIINVIISFFLKIQNED
jgi:putative membrane protein